MTPVATKYWSFDKYESPSLSDYSVYYILIKGHDTFDKRKYAYRSVHLLLMQR